MSPFYSWSLYFKQLQQWIWHFCPQQPLYWPITQQTLFDNQYWHSVIQSATDFDMLDLYGCLDAPL